MTFYLIFNVFNSSRSTADLLTVESDWIAGVFNTFGATRAVALDISKAFGRFWHAGHLHKLKSYGISGQVFDLLSSFLSNIWLPEVQDGKCLQEYGINDGVLQGYILGPANFLIYVNEYLDVICVIHYTSMLMILLSTLSVISHLICGNS